MYNHVYICIYIPHLFDLMPGLFLRPRPTEAAAEDNRSRIEISAYSGNWAGVVMSGEQPPEGLIVNRLAVEAVKEAHDHFAHYILIYGNFRILKWRYCAI